VPSTKKAPAPKTVQITRSVPSTKKAPAPKTVQITRSVPSTKKAPAPKTVQIIRSVPSTKKTPSIRKRPRRKPKIAPSGKIAQFKNIENFGNFGNINSFFFDEYIVILFCFIIIFLSYYFCLKN
jgi:hypothetical protein